MTQPNISNKLQTKRFFTSAYEIRRNQRHNCYLEQNLSNSLLNVKIINIRLKPDTFYSKAYRKAT